MEAAPRTLHKVERREIQSAREALLLKLLSPDTDVKIRQRQFIRELMAEIKALRNLGVDFEEIATVLKEFGCKLSGETLRTYYFDEKREQDEEALHEVAIRYKQAAVQAMDQYQRNVGNDIDSIVRRAVEQAAKPPAKPQASPGAKKEENTPKVAIETSQSSSPPAAAPAANGGRRDLEGGGGSSAKQGVKITEESKSEIKKLVGKHVELHKDNSQVKEKRPPTAAELDELMNTPVDITKIPRRDES